MRTMNMRKQILKNTVIKLYCGSLLGVFLFVALAVQAADFALPDLQGKTHHLADYRGKFVLVNFWATWCSPCLSEIPELNELQAAHKELVLIGVAMQSGSASKVAEFAAAQHMHYPIVMGTRALAEQVQLAAQQSQAIEVLPTSYLFGEKGELLYEQAGEISRVTLERYLPRKKTN